MIFKLRLVNKRRLPPQPTALMRLLMEVTDDTDVEYDYVLSPSSKAEIAHMLSERMNAKERDAYTDRMWRSELRVAEIREEFSKRTY